MSARTSLKRSLRDWPVEPESFSFCDVPFSSPFKILEVRC